MTRHYLCQPPPLPVDSNSDSNSLKTTTSIVNASMQIWPIGLLLNTTFWDWIRIEPILFRAHMWHLVLNEKFTPPILRSIYHPISLQNTVSHCKSHGKTLHKIHYFSICWLLQHFRVTLLLFRPISHHIDEMLRQNMIFCCYYILLNVV